MSYNLIVIKAERIPYDSMSTMYTFPDEDDDLTNYAGGNTQVMVPNRLLQGSGKLDQYDTLSWHLFQVHRKSHI